MHEKVIVSLTTFRKRISNIPVVLDTIFSQTMCPDHVVINLSYNEVIPDNVRQYIDKHAIEINFVEDTKVYKKLIPTLKLYPDDCIICIDDDFLYPKTMVEDFVSTHNHYPNHPVSGNRFVMNGMQCHCGCASLTKAAFLGDYLNLIDDSIIQNCPSDDIVYTFFSNLNGHPYIRTKSLYFVNMPSYNVIESYSSKLKEGGISDTYDYLSRCFGKTPDNLRQYFDSSYAPDIISDIIQSYIDMGRKEVRSTITYKLGKVFLSPGRFFSRFFQRGC